MFKKVSNVWLRRKDTPQIWTFDPHMALFQLTAN